MFVPVSYCFFIQHRLPSSIRNVLLIKQASFLERSFCKLKPWFHVKILLKNFWCFILTWNHGLSLTYITDRCTFRCLTPTVTRKSARSASNGRASCKNISQMLITSELTVIILHLSFYTLPGSLFNTGLSNSVKSFITLTRKLY